MFSSSIFGVILVYVWILEPLGVPLSLPVTLVGALAAWSTKRMGLAGFSVRAFLPACRVMTMFTVPALFVLIALGAILGTLHDRPRFVASLGRLIVWGGAQQWVLQTVVLREVRRIASRHAAIIMTALVFALVHLPNPLLMIVTFVGALAWCACFDRYPNVLPLAVSQALGTLAMLYAFNDTITGRLRIGVSYLRLVRPS